MENALIKARDTFSRHYPEARIEINGRTWGVLTAGGPGPALLLLPGTLGRADIFWQQIQALAPRARIIALSYPAQGGIIDWAKDIATLMAMEEIKSATLLGTSLGGYVAQYFAAIKPEMVTQLIAANTLPEVGFLKHIPPYSADIDTLPEADLIRGFTDGLRQWAVDMPTRATLAALLLKEVESRIPAPELRARLNALKFGPALPQQSLPRARIFTIESDDDHLIPPPIRTALRQSLAPAHSKVFANGSHFPYVVQPEDYNKILSNIMQLYPEADNAGPLH